MCDTCPAAQAVEHPHCRRAGVAQALIQALAHRHCQQSFMRPRSANRSIDRFGKSNGRLGHRSAKGHSPHPRTTRRQSRTFAVWFEVTGVTGYLEPGPTSASVEKVGTVLEMTGWRYSSQRFPDRDHLISPCKSTGYRRFTAFGSSKLKVKNSKRTECRHSTTTLIIEKEPQGH